MKPKLHIADLFVPVIIALPFFYLGYIYNSLPQTVPTHFGIKGQADAFSNKSTLWLTLCILGGLSIFLFLLMRFLPKIDPKKTAQYSAGVFNKIAVAAVLLLCAINFLIVDAAQNGSFRFFRVFPVIMGVFFAFMGNIMHSIKPNYFAGIRTPWTLENEETWRRTHQFGGKLWFVGGLLTAAVCLVVPEAATPWCMMGGIFILAIVPIVYSFIIFKKIKKNETN